MAGFGDLINIYPISKEIIKKLNDIVDNQKAKRATAKLIKEARQFYEQGHYDLALSILKNADTPDLIPEYYVELKYLIGLILSGQGKYEDALGYYAKATEMKPKFADAWVHKGIALYMLGNYEVALQSFENAIAQDKDHPEALYGKGNALQAMGKYDDALEIYLKASEIVTNSMNEDHEMRDLSNGLFYNIGDVEFKLGDYDSANKRFDQVIGFIESEAVRSNDPEYLKKYSLYAAAWFKKCLALKSLGRDTEADNACAKAKELGYKD